MKSKSSQKITPFLWFDNNLEQAIKFYTAIFKDSKVLEVRRYDEAGPDGKTKIMTARFRLAGQEFTGINGGPHFKFTEAVSFVVSCKTQGEVDYYWRRLTAGGGKPGQCAWLKDKFGLSWQIVPDQLLELLGDKDPAKAGRVMQAMFDMQKIIIKDLQRAHAGK
jgi:predicted 3-demethylubiquinone-9 3-methyltransferase (glyoxalase superfamily)